MAAPLLLPDKADPTPANVGSQSLSHTANSLEKLIDQSADSMSIDSAARLVWRGLSEETITEAEAEYLDNLVVRQRSLIGPRPAKSIKRLQRDMRRVWSRQAQRSPDRKKSRERRRTLGGSSSLPPNLRVFYTEGQRAVLHVIAEEVKKKGSCDLPIDKIAAQAGASRTTVQTAQHEARRLGHIQIIERPRRGEKSLTHIVTVISEDWIAWIRKGPRREAG